MKSDKVDFIRESCNRRMRNCVFAKFLDGDSAQEKYFGGRI